jgi:hypothetical protein
MLDSNGFDYLPVVMIGVDSNERIYRLNFEYLGINFLPPEIGQLTALKELILWENYLTNLPQEIGQLTVLEELILYHNQLSSLPSEIEKLTSLKVLSIYHNRLTSLPKEIEQLTNLVRLELDYNHLCSISDSIEAWIDEYSDNPNWRETQDCGPCQDTKYLEYGTDGPCLNLIVYGCMHPDYAEYNPEANVADPDACITLGVSMKFDKAGNLDFQHNPFSNSITITFPNSTVSKSLSTYTITGTLVKQFSTTGNTVTWNVRESGVYYIRAVVDGKRVVRKVVL